MGLMERIGRAIGIGRGDAAVAGSVQATQRRTDPFWRLAYPGGGYGVSGGGVPVGIGQSLSRPSARNLRSLARTPYARRAINAIKNPIAGLTFEIGVRPGVSVTADVSARMAALRRSFERPNEDDSFRSLIEQVLEDTLCGAGAIEQQVTGDPMRPVMLWPADGLSIEVDAGWDGDPDAVRYRQSYTGIGSACVELTNDDLIYIRPNPSTHTPFGLGPLEVAYQSIARQLAVADYAGKVAANTRPGLMLNLGPEIGIDQIQAFRSYWRNEVEGQGLMPIIGAGKEVQALLLTPEGDGALYLKYQDWIVREIASCFDLSPQNMGLERDVNRGTSETAQDRDWDQAIKPFAGLIAAHLNRDLIQGLLGDHELEFRWTGLDRADEQATSDIWRTYYTTNVLTPNEMRSRLGLPKLTAQWGDLLYADAQIAISAARGTKRLDDPALTDDAEPGGLRGMPTPKKPLPPTHAFNPNHVPAGSSDGGQFAPGEGEGGEDTEPSSDPKAEHSVPSTIKEVPRPELEAITKDPKIKQSMDQAWSDSSPGDASSAHEKGFWIVRNPDGSLDTVDFPGNKSSRADGISVPSQAPDNAIAWFHTHPVTVGGDLSSPDCPYCKAAKGASDGDEKVSEIWRIPGIVKGSDGLHYFGPSLPMRK